MFVYEVHRQTINIPADDYLRPRRLKLWQKRVLALGAVLLFILGAWMTLTNHGNNPAPEPPASVANL